MFDCIAIIGVGLIGGSVALAAKKNRLCKEIVGSGRNESELQQAVQLGVIDRYEMDVGEAVKEADLILIAVPLSAFSDVFRQIKGKYRNGAIITDAGSAKASVVKDAQTVFGTLPAGFVPGHPIAGTEKSGVQAAFAELFESRCTIITPLASSASEAVTALTAFWQGCGASVVNMEVAHHDEVLAATSHLPHVLAYALVDSLAQMHERVEIFRYAAGGFRDFTRIASSSPMMWRDICMANKEAVLDVLEQFKKQLELVSQAIADNDANELEAIFCRAKKARDEHVVI